MERPKIDQQITFLYTENLEATADFYENTLGLELFLDQGVCRIYKISRTGFLGFCEKGQLQDDKSTVIFTMVTDQVDDWFSYLKQQGIEFEKSPAENPKFKIYHCFLRDPNGYLIEIQEFLDPRWNSLK